VKKLLADIRACTVCASHLPLGPRPVVTAQGNARILLIGQAPGTKVHASGVPWQDASGKELRRWLGVDEVTFYNEQLFAIMPMGFCYPGAGKSGDMPPRPECAPLWHHRLLKQLRHIKLTLLIGKYAQAYYLHDSATRSLTEMVKDYTTYLPAYFPLPHPSPRNRLWQSKNAWFEKKVVPDLQKRVQAIVRG
jgi:uracil-DNA glycosylase